MESTLIDANSIGIANGKVNGAKGLLRLEKNGADLCLGVRPDSKFADDLGLDSLDSVEVVMAIEDEFAIEIPDAEADRIASIGDAVEYIAAHPMAK